MNLAHVEYYFADFLSAMESDRQLELHSIQMKTDDEKELEPIIKIPENLYIVGTVNIDETTKEFSPKVLDRANTIYLDIVDLDQWLIIQTLKGRIVNNEIFEEIKETLGIDFVPNLYRGHGGGGSFQRSQQVPRRAARGA